MLEIAAKSGDARALFPLCPVAKRIESALSTRPKEAGALLSEHGCMDYPSCLNCKRGQEAVTEVLSRGSDFSGIGVDFLSSDLDALWYHSGGSGAGRQFLSFCTVGKRIRESYQALDGLGAAAKVADYIAETHGCHDVPSCLQCERGVDALEEALLDLCENGLSGPIGKMLQSPYL